MAFGIHQLGLMLSCKFDKFQRIVRDTEYAHAVIWHKYCGRIAADFKMPCVTSEDHVALREAVASLLSFHWIMCLLKMRRWFS